MRTPIVTTTAPRWRLQRTGERMMRRRPLPGVRLETSQLVQRAFAKETQTAANRGKHPRLRSNSHYQGLYGLTTQSSADRRKKGTMLKEQTRGQGDNKTPDLEGISTRRNHSGELAAVEKERKGKRKKKEWKEYACRVVITGVATMQPPGLRFFPCSLP